MQEQSTIQYRPFDSSKVFILTKKKKDLQELESQFSSLGIKANALDVTQLNRSEKRYLLLIQQQMLPNLEPSVFEDKIKLRYFVFSYSDGDKIETDFDLEDHLVLPLAANDVRSLVRYCSMKDQMEQSLQDSQEKIENQQSVIALGNYVGSLVHDLNNLTTITMSSLEAIRGINNKDIKNEQIEFLVDKGLKGSLMLKALTTRYRRFLKSKKFNELHISSLQAIINDALEFLDTDLNRHNIQTIVEVGHQIKIETDEIVFVQSLVNIISNAIYAIKDLPEKWIKIKVQTTVDTVSLLIVDSGKGIDDQVADKVFEPLFTTKPEGEGSGFGLSFCTLELEKLGLRLEYIPGKHTTFGIQIPYAKIIMA